MGLACTPTCPPSCGSATGCFGPPRQVRASRLGTAAAGLLHNLDCKPWSPQGPQVPPLEGLVSPVWAWFGTGVFQTRWVVLIQHVCNGSSQGCLPPGDIWQHLGAFLVDATGQGCFWHPVGRGQGSRKHPATAMKPASTASNGREGSGPKYQKCRG